MSRIVKAFCVNGGRVERRLTDSGLQSAINAVTARMHAQGFMNLGDSEGDCTVRTFVDLDNVYVWVAFGDDDAVRAYRAESELSESELVA